MCISWGKVVHNLWISRPPPPEARDVLYIYVRGKKKLSRIIKLHPDIEDALEATVIASKDHIVIILTDDGVEFKSTLNDKNSVFYIELCKQMILEDWLCGSSTS